MTVLNDIRCTHRNEYSSNKLCCPQWMTCIVSQNLIGAPHQFIRRFARARIQETQEIRRGHSAGIVTTIKEHSFNKCNLIEAIVY